MKIVFINDGIYEYATNHRLANGGAERQQWLLARALSAAGWSVSVGLPQPLKPGDRRTIQGVEFVGLQPNRHLVSWYRFLRSEQPDWWYWRCATHLWGPAVMLAKLARVRTIFAAGFDTDVQPSRALIQRSRWWPLYAWGLSWTDKILLQHSGQLSMLKKGWRAKATIVPSIVTPPAKYTPHVSRDKYVAWVGMLRQPKRPDLLIEIARKMPGIRFVVCGGPSQHRSSYGYGEAIVKQLGQLSNVEFRGQVDPAEALEIIGRSALLLSTSDGEGFPNVFLEAWASGTPVATLRIDPDQVIEKKGLGRVSGSVARAVKDIQSLLDSPEKREAIAAKARFYVADTHSAKTVSKIFESVVLSNQQLLLNVAES
jgi:glycosyltransferase involved in cell wall biosynthesis